MEAIAQFLALFAAIFVINLVLSGDNAIVIALAARTLPARLQSRAIVLGTAGAVAMRIVMTLAVVWLLRIPGLLFAGGVALIWIGYSLLIPDEDTDDSSLAAPGGGAARDVAKRVSDHCGVTRVALTRREILGPRQHGWSAVLYDAETGTFAQSRRHCVEVVDRVGGGDSFAAGLIARLVGGDGPAEALEFAVAASALKLTVHGDFSRASVREVQKLLRA
jgi:hypothetical protein